MVTGGAGPTIHGVHNFWLGGAQHSRADRELGQAIAAEYPSVPAFIRAAQDFHLRAARWAVSEGITRIIHAGNVSALPRGRNVHDAARAADPRAEVVYAYRDAGAHGWADGLLAGRAGVHAVLSGNGGFLDSEPVRTWLGQRKPIFVLAGLLLHFTPPDRAAARIARAAGALPPGSALAASVALAGETERAQGLLDMFTPGKVYRHTEADVEAWLKAAGLKIVEPGVTDVRIVPGAGPQPWGDARRIPDGAPGYIAGVVARRP